MYLTAQHVVSSEGKSGVNAFLYTHGGRAWHVPPSAIPDREPGRLERKWIVVQPPGNRVRSYLDIVAPDDADADSLQRRLLAFLKRVHGRDLPWVAVEGPCLFRVGMEAGLMETWSREVTSLFRASIELLEQRPGLAGS